MARVEVPETPATPSSDSESDSFVRLPRGVLRNVPESFERNAQLPPLPTCPAAASAAAMLPVQVPHSLDGMPTDVLCEIYTCLGVRDHAVAERLSRRMMTAGRYTSSWPTRLRLADEIGRPDDVHAHAAALFRRARGRLESLDLTDFFLSDHCLSAVLCMPRLRHLAIEGSFEAGGYATVARLQHLRSLAVFTDSVAPAALAMLAPLAGLEELHIRGAPLAAGHIAALAALPCGLRSLRAWLTDCGARDLRRLAGRATMRSLGLQLTVDGHAASPDTADAAVRALTGFGPALERVLMRGADYACAAAWASSAPALRGLHELVLVGAAVPVGVLRALALAPALDSLTLLAPRAADGQELVAAWFAALGGLRAGRLRVAATAGVSLTPAFVAGMRALGSRAEMLPPASLLDL